MFSTKKRAPEGAHGQRNVDGSYFAIWMCQNGHGEAGDVDKPGSRGGRCFACSMDRINKALGGRTTGTTRTVEEPTHWRRATIKEAHDHIFSLEGFGMFSGVGYRMLHDRDGGAR